MSDPGHALGLARFGRALRERGVRVSLSDEADGLVALGLVDQADLEEVRRALVVALKVRPGDRAVFDELFPSFWPGRSEAPLGRTSRPKPPSETLRLRPAPRRTPAPEVGAPPELEVTLPEGEEPGYSPEARLRRKAFEECSTADLAAMEKLMTRLALALATRPSRRLVPTRGRGTADLRRSLRRALAHGGELLSLARRRSAIERPRLVVLCDTSGSMDPHARFLLSFVLALRKVARGTEVFAFNTTLVRLTPWLAAGRVDRTLARLASGVPEWSGGTRIGECLEDFERAHATTLLDRRTVVVIFSDGLDRGDVRPLAGALARIRARSRKVIWLNPLAGDCRYEPTARAMAAALPHVDRLLPAHNLESLSRLLREL